MKTIIVSDLHLSHVFDSNRCRYLEQLFDSADQVIINGDFWENHATTFNAFLSSGWQKLFPLLKSKHTIYIFGNHDRRQDSDERANLFSEVQTDSWQLQSGDLHLHIEHGHKLLAKHKDSPDWIVTLFRVSGYDRWFRQPVERYLVRSNQEVMHRWHMGANQAELVSKAQSMNSVNLLVTGHTHLPHFDPELRFANIGYINHGVSYYLEVKDGNAWYVHEEYLPVRREISRQSLLPAQKISDGFDIS